MRSTGPLSNTIKRILSTSTEDDDARRQSSAHAFSQLSDARKGVNDRRRFSLSHCSSISSIRGTANRGCLLENRWTGQFRRQEARDRWAAPATAAKRKRSQKSSERGEDLLFSRSFSVKVPKATFLDSSARAPLPGDRRTMRTSSANIIQTVTTEERVSPGSFPWLPGLHAKESSRTNPESLPLAVLHCT